MKHAPPPAGGLVTEPASPTQQHTSTPSRSRRRSWATAWVGLAGLGVANGALRATYQPLTGDQLAQQISSGTLVVLTTWWARRRLPRIPPFG
jgi:ferric-dicitrate binding protein FerR (iron transport regulator)